MPLALRLTLIDLLRLPLDGKVLMNDADAPLLSKGDGHIALRNRIHRRTEQRDIEADPPRELRGDIHIGGHDLAVAGFQKHVVEGQAELFADLVEHRRINPKGSKTGIGHYAARQGKRKGRETIAHRKGEA